MTRGMPTGDGDDGQFPSSTDGVPQDAGWLARRLLAWIGRYRSRSATRLTGTCKFTPTCSTYAQRAIAERGAVAGGMLAAWRVMRCNRWTAGGEDPVPAKRR